ncbi:hypothetical protein [Paenibacillus montanisoli]|uniref:Uncharacterized protein n=1 Tax=Paenibacillus montanisoli TaxID=2081970 RepID=A0A328U3H0_9BACL|nr:hypothetical protein [Paenibacillus montanisoli]RAP76602.1 hypothetical protein DL346_14660 [Paenibacillus montanisoli]
MKLKINQVVELLVIGLVLISGSWFISQQVTKSKNESAVYDGRAAAEIQTVRYDDSEPIDDSSEPIFYGELNETIADIHEVLTTRVNNNQYTKELKKVLGKLKNMNIGNGELRKDITRVRNLISIGIVDEDAIAIQYAHHIVHNIDLELNNNITEEALNDGSSVLGEDRYMKKVDAYIARHS